ncbi:hypothetical protein Sste5346_006694 [Sporothrix stenoceras]|uniref:MARVEL domain-containing protein n=1 Tax=Sporothrix stenoceras TaxID=5173 RepID=A0ABR3YXP4_9PEZI
MSDNNNNNNNNNNKRPIRSKVVSLLSNPVVILGIRALQFIFAIVVIGAIGRSLHIFLGYYIVDHPASGTTKATEEHISVGFPAAWGYLLFTAIWTVLGVIFGVFTGIRYPIQRSIGYARIVVEVVALVSWFVGFITSAVYVGSNECPLQDGVCGSVNLAVAIGTVEAILFLITAPLTSTQVFYPRSMDINKDSNPGHITDLIMANNNGTPLVQEKEPEQLSAKGHSSMEWQEPQPPLFQEPQWLAERKPETRSLPEKPSPAETRYAKYDV